MMYSSAILFCIHLYLLQYVFSQTHGNSGIITTGMSLPFSPGHSNGLGPGLAGANLGPNGLQGPIGLMGPGNLGMANQGLNMAMGNQGLGMGPLGGPGMAMNGPGVANLNGQMPYGKMPPAAYPAGYGGSGGGDVAVGGELPVAGTTAVNGQVPITGMVQFGGNVPAGGTVTISGMCGCNGQNGPNVPPYGNHYGY